MKNKVILLTGGSSGIGKICATYLASQGYTVYATSRKGPFPPEKPQKNQPIKIQLDVNDTSSINKVIDYIIKENHFIDVVINNAGIHIAGSIEDTPIDKAKEQVETNFFGVHRVCKVVIPYMRDNQKGLIINISSIMGIIGLPYQGFYSAAKFALEGFTESLRIETHDFGIKVCLIEPGDVHIEPAHERWKTPLSTESPYYSTFRHVMDVVEHDEAHGFNAEKIAILIQKILTKKSPKLRYRVGSFSQNLAASLKGVVPDRIHQWILMKYYLP
jgi:short-subunit dehydrogenase